MSMFCADLTINIKNNHLTEADCSFNQPRQSIIVVHLWVSTEIKITKKKIITFCTNNLPQDDSVVVAQHVSIKYQMIKLLDTHHKNQQVGWQEGHPARKNWVAGCWHDYLSWGEVQICIWPRWCHCHSLSPDWSYIPGFTFLVLAYPVVPDKIQRAIKWLL